MEIKILKELLTKIKSIRRLCITLTILTFVIPILFVFLLSNTTNTSNQAQVGLVLWVIILICWIILLVKSCSIHFYHITNYETKEIIRSYKTNVIILTILAFFLFAILFVVIWYISTKKIKFLENNLFALKVFETILNLNL